MGTRLSTARGILCVLLSLFLSHDLASQTVGTVILTARDGAPGDAFGRSVAISGDTLIVGANGDDERGENAGAAYVFVRDASGGWAHGQKLAPPELQPGNAFGWSVDLDGGVAVIGAPGVDAGRGAAYVYVHGPGGWTQHARLQPALVSEGDRFGWRVAIDVDTLLVGAPGADRPPDWSGPQMPDTGSVVAYRRAAPGWALEAVLRQDAWSSSVSGWNATRHFGWSLDVDGDDAAIGSLGFVRRWRHDASGWKDTGWSGEGPFEPSPRRSLATWSDGSVLFLDGSTIVRVRPGATEESWMAVPSPPGDVPGQRLTLWTTLEAIEGTIWVAGLSFVRQPQNLEVYYAREQDATLWKRTPDGTWSEVWFLPGDVRRLEAIEGDRVGGVFVTRDCEVVHVGADGSRATAVPCDPNAGGLSSTVPRPYALAMTAGGALYIAYEKPGGIIGVGMRAQTTYLLRRLDVPSGALSTVMESRATRIAIAEDLTGGVWAASEGRLERLDGAATHFVAGGNGTLTRVCSSSVPPVFVPLCWYFETIDGVGSAAGLNPHAMTVAFDNTLVFTDCGDVLRSATPAGSVVTLSGTPCIGDDTSGLFGYDVALQRGSLAAGSPRSPFRVRSIDRAGHVVVEDEWNPLLVRSDSPVEAGREGVAVAFTAAGDVVVGAANGCVWLDLDRCVDDARATAYENRVSPVRLFRRLDGVWRQRLELPLDGVLPRSGYGNALATEGDLVVVGAPECDYRPQDAALGDVIGPGRVFLHDLGRLDRDGDSLPDLWELDFGLDPTDPADAALDPDGDGLTGAQEHAARTHPHNDAAFTRYFAEGATSAFFETEFAIANPGPTPVIVNLRFLLRTGALASTAVVVPGFESRHVVARTVTGMDYAEFSTTVESDQLVVVDRRMSWPRDDPYAAHAETAIVAPATTWYLAEGATHSGLQLFYLLQNPHDVDVRVRVRYLRPRDAPLDKTYTLPAASRTNIWVNEEEFAGRGRALAATDVSAVIESLDGHPIIVERAMYRDVPGQFFGIGHASAGITTPATEWFLAEGATGAFLDLFVLIANPGDTDAEIEAAYLLPDGAAIVVPHRVAANSRFNIWVDHEDARLADAAVATIVRSTNGVPIIVERALWWPGPTSDTWYEAHASAGATTTATRWVAADGEVDAARPLETYLLIANTSATPADVKVTLLLPDGDRPVSLTFVVAPHSRFNIPVGFNFLAAAGRRFGVIVESLGAAPAQLVVERSMFWNAGGQFWAAGTNALATTLP